VPAATPTVERLTVLLQAVAADPLLGGLLVLDADPALVGEVAGRLAAMVEAADGSADTTRLLMLDAATRDEDIWAGPRPEPPPATWWRIGPGELVEAELAPGAPPVVAIPDLARLGPAGLHALIQFVGADETVVEHGISLRFRPRSRWLAFCGTAFLDAAPRFVLDRFVLRAPAEDLTPEDVRGLPLPRPSRLTPLPAVTDRAVRHLAERLGTAAGPRRLLTAARLTRTMAQLEGQREAGIGHARRAAQAMGLAELPELSPQRGADAYTPPVLPPRTSPAAEGPSSPALDSGVLTTHVPADSRSLPPAASPARHPYPEDSTADAPGGVPLRLPRTVAAHRRHRPGRGPVTGLTQARSLRDLSVVGTVLQATRFRPLRSAHGGPLVIDPMDLREHRRAPLPDRFLVVLLDHTSRDGDDWSTALEPFLRWAYTRRAEVFVVETGSRNATNEACAEVLTVRNVLHPALAAALRRPAGRATPLAHGLTLLARHVHGVLARHNGTAAEVQAVIATDARGNIPLEASLSGRLPDPPVGADGADDARDAAARLGDADRTRLRVFLLAPEGHTDRGLVRELADRLGAAVLSTRGGRTARR
jgi:magnesium chelatase subunit D